MSSPVLKISRRNENHGELRGVESAFAILGEVDARLARALKGAGYSFHAERGCWYSFDPVAWLLLTDTLGALGFKVEL